MYLLVLSKKLTLFSYESYVRLMFMKNSFPPSWQNGRMMGCKIVPLKWPYVYLNQLLTLKLPSCLLPIYLFYWVLCFFSMGVIKFNILSKWYNPYLEYDGIQIKVISRYFKVKCFSKQVFWSVFFLVNVNVLIFLDIGSFC